MSEAGFTIGRTFYPAPTSFRLGDPALVTQVTGMAFTEFAAALDDEDRQADPVILLGMIAVAVWQANPRWTRPKVAAFVEQISLDSIKFEFGEEEAVESAVPPAEAGSAGSLPSSHETSNGSQAIGAEQSSLNSSGQPGSGIGSLESLQA